MLRSFASFVSYCKSLHGTVLHTGAQSKPFRVEVEGNTVFFVPQSSGKRRRANCEKTERVLAELSRSNVWSPGHYQSITYHASYIIAVAKHAGA
ncbi:hypothetical protein JOD69_004226 [Methylocaldum sp. RMAD-M]|jgi:hypothetical protein|nr:hypothetical protein [Methylocaldum sp. RMAD-M]